MESRYIQTLTKLGLTSCQARVYLELVRLGTASAKTISAASKVTRQDVYRIMPALQELGLIDAIIDSPTLFKALSMQEGISLLTERKKVEDRELYAGIKDLLHNFEKKEERKFQDPDPQFVLIPFKEANLRLQKKALERTQKTFDFINSISRFPQAMFFMSETINKAARRDVKIRLITEKPIEDEHFSKELNKLVKSSCTEIRYLGFPPKATVIIFDGRETSILASENASWVQSRFLWSTNSSFVAMIQDHFDASWEKAKPVSSV